MEAAHFPKEPTNTALTILDRLIENLFNVEPFFVFYTESVMLGSRFIPESVFYTQSVMLSPRFIPSPCFIPSRSP